MFTVLNCMPYVLAWPLNEKCNWSCLKNMRGGGLCIAFTQQRKSGGEESTQHKAVNSQLLSDMQVKTHLFLLPLSLLGPVLPVHSGMEASCFSLQPLAGCLQSWVRSEESVVPELLLRLVDMQRTMLTCWCSKGMLYPVQGIKLCPVLCIGP